MFEGLYVLLGAILTFAGTFLVESWKNLRERKEKTQNFILYTRQELNSVLKSLDKLKTVQGFRKYWDYSVLEKLNKSIQNLESEKKAAIYLPKSELQEAYIDLISDISFFVSDAIGMQQFYDSQKKELNKELFKTSDELTKFYEERKTEKSIDLVDIKRKIEDFIRQLQSQ